MPELGDAHLRDGVRGRVQRLLQGLVDVTLLQPVQKALLTVGQVKEVLSVRGDQDQTEIGRLLQVRDVRVEEPGGVELGQADGRPALPLSEGRGRGGEVGQQVEVGVMEVLLLLPDQSDESAPGEQDGEDEVLGAGRLQAGADDVARGAAERQAHGGVEHQPRVHLQQAQQPRGDALGSGQQSAQVEALTLLEDALQLRQSEQAQDLIVDIVQLSPQLTVRLTRARHTHQHQRTLTQEHHAETV